MGLEHTSASSATPLEEGVLVHPHMHDIMHTYADLINKKRSAEPKKETPKFRGVDNKIMADPYYHRDVYARMLGPAKQHKANPNRYSMTYVLHKNYKNDRELHDSNRVQHFTKFHDEHQEELHAAAAKHGFRVVKSVDTTAGSGRSFGGYYARNVHLERTNPVKEEILTTAEQAVLATIAAGLDLQEKEVHPALQKQIDHHEAEMKRHMKAYGSRPRGTKWEHMKEASEVQEAYTSEIHLEPHTGSRESLPVHLQSAPGPVYKVKKSSRDLHAHGLHPGALVHDTELDALHDDGVQVHMKEETELAEIDSSTLRSYLKKRVAGFDPLSAKVNKHIEGVDTAHFKLAGRGGVKTLRHDDPERDHLTPGQRLHYSMSSAQFAQKQDALAGKHFDSVKSKEDPLKNASEDDVAKLHKGFGARRKAAEASRLSKYDIDMAKKSVGYIYKEETSPLMAAAMADISARALVEGRGRPRKDGTEVEGDDTHLHPINQIEKIALAIKGAEPAFTHEDGTQSRISKEVARHHLTMYKSLPSPETKLAYGQRLFKSRESMMQAGRQTAHLAFVPNRVNFKG